MRKDDARYGLSPLLAGSVLAAAGSAVALWLPGGLAGAIALFLMLRICWLEENIRSDLMHATRMPDAYRSTQRVQVEWQILFFGAASEPIDCPRRLASILRIQSHALYILLLGAGAAFLARNIDVPGLGLIAGGGLLILACARIDRLVQAEAILATGAPLPSAMLEDRGPIARFVLNQ